MSLKYRSFVFILLVCPVLTTGPGAVHYVTGQPACSLDNPSRTLNVSQHQPATIQTSAVPASVQCGMICRRDENCKAFNVRVWPESRQSFCELFYSKPCNTSITVPCCQLFTVNINETVITVLLWRLILYSPPLVNFQNGIQNLQKHVTFITQFSIYQRTN